MDFGQIALAILVALLLGVLIIGASDLKYAFMGKIFKRASSAERASRGNKQREAVQSVPAQAKEDAPGKKAQEAVSSATPQAKSNEAPAPTGGGGNLKAEPSAKKPAPEAAAAPPAPAENKAGNPAPSPAENSALKAVAEAAKENKAGNPAPSPAENSAQKAAEEATKKGKNNIADVFAEEEIIDSALHNLAAKLEKIDISDLISVSRNIGKRFAKKS